MEQQSPIEQAAAILRQSRNCVIFTGAGISVESGIPAFRGEGGLWQHYNPECIELGYFQRHPEESWRLIKEIFYDHIAMAEPNNAHYACAKLEKAGYVSAVITQNIDDLHRQAGSMVVHEFHGTVSRFICTSCSSVMNYEQSLFDTMPPRCPKCGGILKPDFVFFSEPINADVLRESEKCVGACDCMIIIGTSGEIMPASLLPYEAQRHGARIIEINPQRSAYTDALDSVHIPQKATGAMAALLEALQIQ